MKKAVLLLLASVLIVSALAWDITPNQLLFKTSKPAQVKGNGRMGLSAFDGYLNSLGAQSVRQITGMPNNQYFMVNVAVEPDYDALVSGKTRFEGIEYVQPNYLNKMHIEPNDELYAQLYHYVVSCPQAWNITTGSDQVLVAVVDSGMNLEHPDLMANIYINHGEIPDNGIDDDGNGYIDDWIGWDFVDAPELAKIALGDYLEQDNDPSDENFHGTHVAGIIGAVGNNGIGVCGVNWNVKLLAVRAGFRTTDSAGFLQDDDAAAAIIYSADMGAQVINLSWGDDKYSPIIADACQYAYDKGAVIVASAGNVPLPFLSYPAKLGTTISVGAVNRNRNLAGFSSFGPDLDLVAPGEEVLSTYMLESPNQYTRLSGTSMSAPYVSGAIALLLALNPGLSPQEVRSRLLDSCDDLGTPGYDMYYGHGMLNVRKLLESTNPPLIHVSSPVEMQGMKSSFDITGSIQAEDFFRYSVMYATKDIPATIIDWLDVETHTNQPNYKTSPVDNDVLAHFYIPGFFEERTYLVRIQYENKQGKKYNQYFNFRYDMSAPVMRPETLQTHYRYEKQDKRYYVTALFDEVVSARLKVLDSLGQVTHCYSAMEDSLVFWALPRSIAEGYIKMQVEAHNASGLTYVSDIFPNKEFPDSVYVQYELIDSYGYDYEVIGEARAVLPKLYDFDGDGNDEYIAMTLATSGYGGVKAYRPAVGPHTVTHDFEDGFWPRGVTQGRNGKAELLYNKGDTAFLQLCGEGQDYPSTAVWQETSSISGVFADYNGDGVDEILLIRNLALEQIIQAYKRGAGDEVEPKNELKNTTATSMRNSFAPTIIVDDLDGDRYPDILCTDADGDVMIFEIRNDQVSDLSWQHRLPVGDTQTFTVGDFDGDGRKEFFVGGYVTDVANPYRNFWYFEGFKNVANNEYVSMGSMFFNDVMEQNSIASMDVDDDGKDEIILGITPNLYIIEYIDGEFKPTFRGESSSSYNILTFRDANNKPYFATNKSIEDSLYFVQYARTEPFTGPSIPKNLSAEPLNESSVRLTWLDNGADSYYVYRKDEEGDVLQICNCPQNSYVDEGLSSGETYQYSVKAVDSGYTPAEGRHSPWVSAIPLPAPQLESIGMVSSSEVKLIFDSVMQPEILNTGLYSLDHDIGYPISINSIAAQRGVLLRFRKPLPPSTQPYVLTAENMRGKSGVICATNSFSFAYEPDTKAPEIEGVLVAKDRASLQITFSEPIASSPDPLYRGNYTFRTTANDPDNDILSIAHDSDIITISFIHPLKVSNQPYNIRVENIQDLAGNTISRQHSVARISLSDAKDLSELKVYPNPVYTSQQSWVAIHNFPMNKKGRISIYDSSGNLVHKARLGPYKPELANNTYRWELRNDSGHRVSSGVYFYVAEMGGETAKGKFVILR
ncbi:MAG: S8 family serine peptidase [Candidatus Cloacimonadaceae bacterium]|jgi:subtilisin family serine protease